MLLRPRRQGLQRSIVEGSSECGQLINYDGRRMVSAATHDEVGGHQTGEGLAERLVLDRADGLA